jgi:hypothetical protein
MTTHIAQRTLIGVLLVILVCVGVWYAFIYREEYLYRWFEYPAIQAASQKVSGLQLRGIRDLSPSDEPGTVQVVFRIENNQDFALIMPTRSSFEGGGLLILSGIGNCTQTPYIDLRQDEAFRDLALLKVSDVVANYRTIDERVRARDTWCIQGISLEPIDP